MVKIKRMAIEMLLVSMFAAMGFFVAGRVGAQAPVKTNDQANKASVQAVEQPKDEPNKSAPAAGNDFYSAAQTVNVASENGTGDVAAAGANVIVSGAVRGYVMAAGANVNINAPVGNDLWVGAANLVVNSTVADNAMLAGSSVVIEKGATIGRDLRVGASFADIGGNVARNLYIGAADARISSEVGGDVVAYTEKLTLNPGAIVRGNLVVHSPNEPAVSPQAQVLGRIDFHRTEPERRPVDAVVSWLGNWILRFLWVTVLGLAMVWFSSVWTNRVAEVIRTQTGRSFLVGLVVMLLVPIVFIILLVTVVGLPLAFLLGAASLVALLLSSAFVSYFVGGALLKKLKRWEGSDVLKIVFGAALITFAMALPWIGLLAKLAVVFFGVGAFILERRDLLGRLREQSLA